MTFGLTAAPDGTTADFAINQVSLRIVSSAPEPSTLAIAGLGGLGLVVIARRRRAG